MKKLCILFCLMLLMSGCAKNNLQNELSVSSSTSEATTLETEAPVSTLEPSSDPPISSQGEEFDIHGRYSVYTEAGSEYGAITFCTNNRCTLFISYFHGVCDVMGTYKIEGVTITVDVELKGSFFEGTDEHGRPYMEDHCEFRIVSNNEIVLESKLYNWEVGNSFVKE